jgi:hypothetical protein
MLLTCFELGDRPLPFPVISEAAHGTSGRWNAGCHCTLCQRAHSDAQRRYGRRRAQKRLPVEVRQQLLDAIYGRPAVPDSAPRPRPDL